MKDKCNHEFLDESSRKFSRELQLEFREKDLREKDLKGPAKRTQEDPEESQRIGVESQRRSITPNKVNSTNKC